MHLSFLDYLRTGGLPPILSGTSRKEVLRQLGTPTSWVSKDDPLFQPPRLDRDYHVSDSFSYGSIVFSFNAQDVVESIMFALCLKCAFPPGSLFFPESTTTIYDVADLMRGLAIKFEDSSEHGDGSLLETSSGVIIAAGKEGKLLSCHSRRQTIGLTIGLTSRRSQPPLALAVRRFWPVSPNPMPQRVHGGRDWRCASV